MTLPRRVHGNAAGIRRRMFAIRQEREELLATIKRQLRAAGLEGEGFGDVCYRLELTETAVLRDIVREGAVARAAKLVDGMKGGAL